jgi:peptidoglycan/xylan/chitin deacetylase (PgdA/CDA1 family)
MSSRLLILGWHNIEPTWSFHGTSAEAGRRGFERQVRLLRRWASVVPLGPALADLAAGRPLPSRAVALTFDDGYLDNATFAAPLLRDAGLTATFFLVPDFLSGAANAWWEELGRAFAGATAAELLWDGERFDLADPTARRAALASVAERLKNLDSRAREDAVGEISDRLRPPAPAGPQRLFMNWEEAGELLEAGHDIGSHTCSHPILSRELPDEQLRQLTESRQALEARFGRPVDLLAYPNGREGDFSAATMAMAEQAGYRYAVTTRAGLVRPGAAPHTAARLVVDPATRLRHVVRDLVR